MRADSSAGNLTVPLQVPFKSPLAPKSSQRLTTPAAKEYGEALRELNNYLVSPSDKLCSRDLQVQTLCIQVCELLLDAGSSLRICISAVA